MADIGEANPDRPGSESEAKVREGFPRNLGDPVCDHSSNALRHGAIKAGPYPRGPSPRRGNKPGDEREWGGGANP